MELNLNIAADFSLAGPLSVSEKMQNLFYFHSEAIRLHLLWLYGHYGEVSRTCQAVMMNGGFRAFRLPWEVSKRYYFEVYIYISVS